MSMAQSMQISEIADMIGGHDTRVWQVVKYYVENFEKLPPKENN